MKNNERVPIAMCDQFTRSEFYMKQDIHSSVPGQGKKKETLGMLAGVFCFSAFNSH